jgi:hypothetical protein
MLCSASQLVLASAKLQTVTLGFASELLVWRLQILVSAKFQSPVFPPKFLFAMLPFPKTIPLGPPKKTGSILSQNDHRSRLPQRTGRQEVTCECNFGRSTD